MTSKVIQTITGNDVQYKVIKDGYKTITETIHITDDMPTRTTYDLSPSTVAHNPELDYTIDTSHEYPPVITFNKNVVTPDDTEITTNKYVLAPYGQDYFVIDNQQEDNFTKVGNVQVDKDGIVSGFNATNSLQLPEAFNPGNNPWEIVLKVKFGSRSCFFFGNTTNTYGIVLGKYNTADGGKLHVYLSSNSSSWNIASGLGDLVLEDNTEYYIKLSYDLTSYKLEASVDGITWQTSTSINSSEKICQSTFYLGSCWDSSITYCDGSIDLSESYIKINNEIWWQPTFSKLISNYVVIGELKIYNGITQQPFTSTNYVNTIPQSFTQVSPTASSWEWVFKIEQYVTSNQIQCLYSQGRVYETMLSVNASNKLNLVINNTANSTNVVAMAGSTTLVSGNSYWIKARFTGSSYQLLLSTDGKTWRSEASTSSTTKLAATSNENWHIGYNYHSNSSYHYLLQSKLNLHESYIKVNEEYWWRGIKIDSNTFIPGILDTSYLDTGDQVTLNLYDVETNKRTLILNTNRDVTVQNKQYVEYNGEITIPDHGLSVYDPEKYTWSKYRIVTLNVNDEDTGIYTEGNI